MTATVFYMINCIGYRRKGDSIQETCEASAGSLGMLVKTTEVAKWSLSEFESDEKQNGHLN